MMLQDYHTHTLHSFDGVLPVDERVGLWAAAGVTHMAVTDHADFVADKPAREQVEPLVAAFAACQSELTPFLRREGNPRIAFGAELGQPLYCPDAAESFLKAFAFDVVLGGQHEVPGQPDFYFVGFTPDNVQTLLDSYFDELEAVIRWGKFDVLAHLTYPWRRLWTLGLTPPEAAYMERIETLLQLLIERVIALEINTSGCSLGFEAIPSPRIVKLYRQLGGERLTVGSDDHKGIFAPRFPLLGMRLAAEAGFTHLTVFDRRRPELIRFAE